LTSPAPQIRQASFRENLWGQNEIILEYAGLSFTNEKSVKYKTPLAGYDDGWSAETAENKIRYTNLAAFLFLRRYTFAAMACNNDGVWSNAPLQYSFAVQPAWWLRWWAMTGQLILLAALIYGIQRYRTRQLQARSRELERTVQERTAEIQAQKQNIERLSDIGKEITASLDFDTIFDKLYERVNQFAEATVFGVGLYHADNRQIEYRLAIEKGKRYAPYTRDARDKNQLPVWCIENRQPVFINDVAQEKVLGVITIQSYQKNAYTDYHLNLLQNLAAYTSIALDNADAYRRLNGSLENLKAMQQQLVTQEKLASLGQLTAGIAHEIKNPLNFVNNFAELSVDLAKELREEIEKRRAKSEGRGEKGEGRDDFESIEEILETLIQNAEKINHHGKRADGIVKSMMQHARGSSGQRELADINYLLDEAVNLVYHGLRANDVSFNVTIEKEYDESIGKLNVVPQDVSRVFLNIVNNAAYAAFQKQKANGTAWRAVGAKEQTANFSPTLSVSTKNLGDKIEIRIRDNGNGIPAEIREFL